MQIFSKIDIGRIRHSNQDAYFACELSDGSAFAVVCDGMGGANAGNVASESAVRSVSSYVSKSYRTAMDTSDIENLLRNAIISANIEVYDTALKNPDLKGMGTTVVAMIIRDKTAVICHVGDSRAYLVNDEITQLTTDHSMVQTLLETGKLTLEEAKVHPRRNVITRALGVEENVLPDCNVYSIKDGETVLLCTDGLSNFVEPAEMLEIFKNNKIENVVGLLTERANENGGGDNITVITVTL